MEKCHAITILGPCPNDVTPGLGDYCIIHASGGDHFKAAFALLWRVHAVATAALSIIIPLVETFGRHTIFNLVEREGEARSLDLDKMKDSAETVIGILDVFAEMENPERGELESFGHTISELHNNVILLVQHLATSYRTAQTSAEKRALTRTE